jgi:RecB family exonuclease
VRRPPPEGWSEIFRGPAVRGDVLHAVLESAGLHPVLERSGAQSWWSGGASALEECHLYVPEEELDRAREMLSADPPASDEPGC